MIWYMSWQTVNQDKFVEHNANLLHSFPGMYADIKGLHFNIIHFITDVKKI